MALKVQKLPPQNHHLLKNCKDREEVGFQIWPGGDSDWGQFLQKKLVRETYVWISHCSVCPDCRELDTQHSRVHRAKEESSESKI